MPFFTTFADEGTFSPKPLPLTPKVTGRGFEGPGPRFWNALVAITAKENDLVQSKHTQSKMLTFIVRNDDGILQFGLFGGRFPGSLVLVILKTSTFARGGSIGTFSLVLLIFLVLLGLGPLGSRKIGGIMTNRRGARTGRAAYFLLSGSRALRSREQNRRIRIPISSYIIKDEQYFGLLTNIGRRVYLPIGRSMSRRNRNIVVTSPRFSNSKFEGIAGWSTLAWFPFIVYAKIKVKACKISEKKKRYLD